ncbi:tyrosine-type recombinase/integrase [Leucobacter chironomi]|uniref:tyrosine-type recombinase/integrase n=1 Tax=Leucobacter chironomi TaxID=491918 RepID=UPI0003F4E4E3|nr:tyrosine-type recombinase/integrase [Leucobacter chironomi]
MKLRSYQLRRLAVALPDADPLRVGLDDLAAWLSAKDWSAQTRRSARSAARQFFGWLQLTGRRMDNPALGLRSRPAPPGTHRPADEMSVRRIQGSADERTALMGKLASIEAMRACEIAVVHTDDVIEDLVGHSLIVHGKGGKTRTIPLDDEIAREILDRPRGYVFPGRIDGHLSAPYVSKLLSRALPPGVTGHMLRHRGAGKVYAGTGYDLRATQKFLGHASVVTTQIYTPARDSQMRLGMLAAAERAVG